MTGTQRSPHRHTDTGPERKEQRVLEKEQRQKTKSGGQTTDSYLVRWSQGDARAQRDPAAGRTERHRVMAGQAKGRMGRAGRPGVGWGVVGPYHTAGWATTVLQLHKGFQVLLALQ